MDYLKGSMIFGLVTILLLVALALLGAISDFFMSKTPNRRNWRIFARSPIASNLDRFESEMSETIAKKKALEYELKNAQNEKTAVEQEYQLQLARQRYDFQMEKDRLLKDIELQKKQAEFDFKLKEKELPSTMVTDGESGGDFGGYRSQSVLDRSQGSRGSEFSNGASQKISSHQERELMVKLDRLEARLDANEACLEADEDEFVSGMA
jgi:hypothetical protein